MSEERYSMLQNRCYTYFKIVGNFNPDEVTRQLGLLPCRAWSKGDLDQFGKKHDFALWEFGRCEDYDVIVANQMRKTIEPLLDKSDVLNMIRQENDVGLYLEVVPTLYCNETSPCLAPTLEIIDFCHATRTELDIDLYLHDSKD